MALISGRGQKVQYCRQILVRRGESSKNTSALVSWLRRVDRATKADYEMGRQITIDGWIISETEARLCALHHLQQLP